MSEFCGKCDLWDTVYHIGKVRDDSDWSKIHIYQRGKDSNDVDLNITSLKDLIKYAPYLISVGIGTKEECKYWITSESFIDREDRESLEWKLKTVKQIYRRCKRKGIEFTLETVKENIFFTYCNEELIQGLYERVKAHPYTKNISGLHTNLHQIYREYWVEGMMEYGWTEEEAKNWVYNGK